MKSVEYLSQARGKLYETLVQITSKCEPDQFSQIFKAVSIYLL